MEIRELMVEELEYVAAGGCGLVAAAGGLAGGVLGFLVGGPGGAAALGVLGSSIAGTACLAAEAAG